MTLRKFSLALVFLMGISFVAAAQVPQQEKIHFSVATPFELKGTDIVLPAGNYLLFQVAPNDRSLFALYQDDMTHSPLAMIRTVRIYYSLGRLPGKAKMLMETDEASAQNYPVLEGWNTPGDYGWRVIEITPRSGAFSAGVQVRR